MKILVVDDEPEMTSLLARGLAVDGHDVAEAHDGIAAIRQASDKTAGVDVAIVDVMLPGMSGFELTRRLKEIDPRIAVILLTARDAVDDRVRGLDSGADDYMVKPFDLAELSARIRAIRRRDALHTQTTIEFGGLTLDLVRHRARSDGAELMLSRTEFDLLRVLAHRHDQTVSRADILDEVWETREHIDPNIVDQYLSALRRKLDRASASVRIVTTRGVGFQLVDTGV